MRLQRLTRAAAAIVLAGLVTSACKQSDAVAAEAARSACSITLSGAMNGTFPCASDQGAQFTIKANQSLIGFSSADAGPSVMVAIKVHGEPTTKTYRSSDPDAAQGIWGRSGNKMWIAMGSTEPTRVGSYSLTLTSVKEQPLASDTKGYEVHGTLTATLQADPDTGASGTVTLNAKF